VLTGAQGNTSGYLSTVVSITAGAYHTCAVSSTSNVYCWGFNFLGQLGVNSDTGPQICSNSSCSQTPIEVLTGAQSNTSGYLSNIVSITAGAYHTCALSSSGNIYCWGLDLFGQLGFNSDPQICIGNCGSETPVEVVTGTQGNASGLLSGIVSISAGGFHTCAVSSSGNVYCWGYNTNGQLGVNSNTGPQICNGSDGCSEMPVEVLGVGGSGYLSNISSVTAGSSHTCALSSSGNVYCWGANNSGQLGNNSTTQGNTPIEVEGVGGTGFLFL
jgi:alpha-tubulin suppressor-like RCC1 family protein